MGYTTKFSGELKFTREPTVTELAFVKSLFWIEDKEITGLGLKFSRGRPHYVQFEFTDNFDGIKWDGSEKFYKPVEAVNFIIENLRERFSDLGLKGTMAAQGEECDDRWLLVIGEDGWATEVRQPLTGQKVTCPECRTTFILDDPA